VSLLLIALVAACEWSATDRTDPGAAAEVPIEMVGPAGGGIAVAVHINGAGPFRFLLDTGATMTCVDHDLRQRLNLPRAAGVDGIGAGIGMQGSVLIVSVDSLRIGTNHVADMQACVVDLAPLERISATQFDGLLGLNVLRQFHVTLDFERGVIRLIDN
jgi:predicted aspartyl protease